MSQRHIKYSKPNTSNAAYEDHTSNIQDMIPWRPGRIERDGKKQLKNKDGPANYR